MTIAGSFLLVLLSLLVGSRAAVVLPTQCYHEASGIEHSNPWGPCGVVSPDSGFLSCCAVGDQCLDSGLCHYVHDVPAGSNASKYYVGGCTDSTLADPSCNPGCNQLVFPDVVFNRSLQTWFCCGAANTNIHCDTPTTQTVSAIPQESIATTYVVPTAVATTGASSSSGTPSTSGKQTSTPTTSPTASPQPTNSGSSGAPAGAIAGGVVGGVALIVIILGAWFFIRRRSKRRRVMDTIAPVESFHDSSSKVLPAHQNSTTGYVETAADPERIEMEGRGRPAELDVQAGQGKGNSSEVMHELP